MSEDLKILLGLVVAIIAVPTGIFGLLKAYIELKKAHSKGSDTSKGASMHDSHDKNISIKKS